MHDFKRLRVWQMASRLDVLVERAVTQFPRIDHGISASQLRRAAGSIPANIAEGCGIGSRREATRYLRYAARSAMEVESHLIQAVRKGFLHPRRAQELLNLVSAVQPMIASLIRKLPDDSPG